MIRKAEKEGLDYLLKAQDKLQTAGNYRILSYCQRAIANYQQSLGNYTATMEYMLKAIHSAEIANSSDALISSWTGLGDLYTFLGDYNNSLIYLKKAGEEIEKLKGSMSQYAIL